MSENLKKSLLESVPNARGVVIGGSSKPRVARLVLERCQTTGFEKNRSFKSRKYLGLNIVCDVIERAYDIEVGYTSIQTINEWDVVLISLSSTPDVYDLVNTFEKYDLPPIRPKIIIGGAGVLNIRPYLKYGDFFVFGRGEVAILDIMEHLVNNAPLENESVFVNGRDDLDAQKFRLAQAETPYPHEVDGLKEDLIGCKLKCLFCGFTYHRKPEKGWSSPYQFESHRFWSVAEMTIKEVAAEIKSGRRAITSIDGSSARLRELMLKPLTDDEYREAIVKIRPVEADSVFLKVFNICGYPTETSVERLEPFTVLDAIGGDVANSTTILYQINPFIPMALTPAQYLPADVFTDYRAWYKSEVRGRFGKWKESARLRVGFASAMNTNLGLLKRCLVHRGVESDNLILRNIIFNKSLNRGRASVVASRLLSLPDMERFYRKYEPGEAMPFDYLQSYSNRQAIDNLARKLHEKLDL